MIHLIITKYFSTQTANDVADGQTAGILGIILIYVNQTVNTDG